ncbi:hypothetical protein GZ78_20715 [Endozoicomonas numazuensis]|uniref:Uncharacterized protein n=1 Tax=Endozoicomonas numazuensis TaxID=1137799 RepID=A0A081NCY8_9GAMM|nr:hypothetical protein GZ78_20715 [Endozoicomonas numazuensis]
MKKNVFHLLLGMVETIGIFPSVNLHSGAHSAVAGGRQNRASVTGSEEYGTRRKYTRAESVVQCKGMDRCSGSQGFLGNRTTF